jgi:hypothetical protein
MPETQALLPRIMGAGGSTPTSARVAPIQTSPTADLRTALAELRAAAVSFDHARAQLQLAMERAEQLVGGMEGVDLIVHRAGDEWR